MNLNINKDDSSINDYLICWEIFEQRPNKVLVHNTYKTNLLKSKLSLSEYNLFTEIIPSDEDYIINNKVLCKISDTIYVSYISIDITTENSMASEVTFFYKELKELKKIEELINKLDDCVIDFNDVENNLNTLTINNGTFNIESINTKTDSDDDIDFFYASSTMKDINKLIKTIKKNKKGLAVFYGERGTGKTSMIKYLSSKLDRTIIYIPNTLIDSINNCDFAKFLKEFDKPIIVIDDCEVIFNDYFSKSNTTCSNLIQLLDGLNDNEINIITIFNDDDDEIIDENILDCNCFIDKIFFDYLSSDEANQLSTHIGNKSKYDCDIKLNNIVNKRKQTPDRKLGFE